MFGIMVSLIGLIIMHSRAQKTGAIHLLEFGKPNTLNWFYIHKDGTIKITPAMREVEGQLYSPAPRREPEAGAVLKEAFAMGLSGVKLHTHVQCFDMQSDAMDQVCEICSQAEKPMVVHAGQEPKSPAYKCDPYLLCSADKTERLLKRNSGLKICVPHLGMGEYAAYRRLIETYDTLWLDTTMAITDFFPSDEDVHLTDMRTDRIMYGTDFPNIPYAWDRELKKLMEHPLAPEALANILGGNAVAFFNLNFARFR